MERSDIPARSVVRIFKLRPWPTGPKTHETSSSNLYLKTKLKERNFHIPFLYTFTSFLVAFSVKFL